jgi:hypothetical protein
MVLFPISGGGKNSHWAIVQVKPKQHCKLQEQLVRSWVLMLRLFWGFRSCTNPDSV